MPDIHTIRLREPWKCEPCNEGVIWRRSFNWPAGLTAWEVVWLVVEGLPTSATVSVNDESLTAPTPSRFDITRLITETNRIAITADSATDTCPFDVRLEIDEG